MPEDQWVYCSKCGRKLAKIENGQVIFEDRKIKAVLCNFIVCKGRYPDECGEINYIK
jgi:hypothetical protein